MSNILIVDDEPSIRESLTMILAEDGHSIDTAGDGMDAMDFLKHKGYDLVLSDIRMPRMDGMELLKQIRTQLEIRLPVILLSAYANEQTVAEALHNGASDLIVKPFDMKTVREAVNYAISNRTILPLDESDVNENHKQRIEHREHAREVGRKLLEFSVLDQIGKTVSAISGIERIGSTIISMVQQILKVDYALIVIYQQDRQGYEYRCTFINGQATLAEPTPADEFILEWLSKNRRSLFVPNVQQDKDFSDCYPQGSLVAVPFLRKFQMLGALLLFKADEQEPLDREALQFLSVLASMATAAIENASLYSELKSYFNGTVKALLTTIEAKDSSIYNHSSRVARYALMIARKLEINEVELRRLEYLAMLHDIGKIGVPEDILRQKAKLSDWENEILKTHCLVGENIVRPINFLPNGGDVIRHHHEHFDGHGYPDGMKGGEIPLFSRIIAIANYFDMITSDYPRQQKLDATTAMEKMIREAGKMFDPELLAIFLKSFQQNINKEATT